MVLVIPEGNSKPVVLVTAYRPDPEPWDEGFLRRRNYEKAEKTKYLHEDLNVAEIEVEVVEMK